MTVPSRIASKMLSTTRQALHDPGEIRGAAWALLACVEILGVQTIAPADPSRRMKIAVLTNLASAARQHAEILEQENGA